MDSAATGAAAGQAVAAAALGRRRRDDHVQAGIDDETEFVKRKYGLDFDILECPICAESFSPPVFQCSNGHTACAACCKKLESKKCPTCAQPTGSIRCMAIEKILDSVLVSCKYAGLGCREMLKRADLRKHEEESCEFEPFRCPVQGCAFHGSEVTVPAHMAAEHRVPVVTLNRICGAGFVMNTSDPFVIVKGEEEGGDKLAYVVHHLVNDKLGDVFFCTAFGGFYRRVTLRVSYSRFPSVCISISGARAEDLRYLDEFWNHQFITLPFMQSLSNPDRPIDVHFGVSAEEHDDDADDEKDDRAHSTCEIR